MQKEGRAIIHGLHLAARLVAEKRGSDQSMHCDGSQGAGCCSQSGFGGQTFIDRPCLCGEMLRKAKALESQWLYHFVVRHSILIAFRMLRMLRMAVSYTYIWSRYKSSYQDPLAGWMPPGKWNYGEDLSAETVPDAKLLCCTINYVHPHNDFPEMGNTAVCVYDANTKEAKGEAERQARLLIGEVWQRRLELAVATFSVAQAVARGRSLEGPVLLLGALAPDA
jgi:hypothetical protein